MYPDNRNPYPLNQNQNPQYGNPYPPNYNQRPADNRKEEPGKGFAVASMVLGLISLVLFCTGINIITAILAIVFGIIHLVKQKQNHGMAVAGIVTAVVGILAFVTYWLLIIHAAGRTSGPDEFLRRYEYQFDGEMKAPDDYQDLEDYLQHNFENFSMEHIHLARSSFPSFIHIIKSPVKIDQFVFIITVKYYNSIWQIHYRFQKKEIQP